MPPGGATFVTTWCAAVSLSPPGNAALSLTALVGPGCLDVARQAFAPRFGSRSCEFIPERPYVGHVVSAASGGAATDAPTEVDEVVAIYTRHSTAPWGASVEICGHGGPIARAATMRALVEAGAEHISPSQARGRLEREPQRLEAHLAEAARSAPTREALSLCVEPAARRVRQELTAALDELKGADMDSPSLPLTRERLARLLEHSQAALNMLNPPRVTLLGTPNVGKSSLFNRMVGFERSLIADRPGTTRDRLEELAVLCPGLAIRLTDTGGLDAGDELGTKVSAISRASAQQSQLLLWVLDASRDPTPEELDGLRSHPQATVVGFNKYDLISATDAKDLAQRLHQVRQATGKPPVCISALTGAGLPALRQALRAALEADKVLPPAQPTAATERTVRCAQAAIAALDRNAPARAHCFVQRALRGGAHRHESPGPLVTSGTGREDQHDH